MRTVSWSGRTVGRGRGRAAQGFGGEERRWGRREVTGWVANKIVARRRKRTRSGSGIFPGGMWRIPASVGDRRLERQLCSDQQNTKRNSSWSVWSSRKRKEKKIKWEENKNKISGKFY